MVDVICFSGWDHPRYGEFSNLSFTPYISGDIKFDTSAHEYVYRKAIYFKDYNISGAVMRMADPSNVLRLGRMIKGYDEEEWNSVRFIIMCSVLRNKFDYSSNLQIRKKLIDTKGKELVNTEPNDLIWGSGTDEKTMKENDQYEFEGWNLMGKALMKVRKEMIEKYT